jgi:hypothetical protein
VNEGMQNEIARRDQNQFWKHDNDARLGPQPFDRIAEHP